MAFVAQAFKVVEHAGRHGGDWGLWHLLPVPDPEGQTKAVATAEDYSAVVATRREEVALSALMQNGKSTLSGLDDVLDAGKAPRRPKRTAGKGGKEGRDGKAEGPYPAKGKGA